MKLSFWELDSEPEVLVELVPNPRDAGVLYRPEKIMGFELKNVA